MSLTAAFSPQSPTIAIVTNATPSTATSTTLSWPLLVGGVQVGPANPPSQVRVRSPAANTADVFLSINGGDTATIPSGTTYSNEMPVAPNSVEVFGGVARSGKSVVVNTISSVASQTLYLTFGEGL
jgi:hypothetical protein